MIEAERACRLAFRAQDRAAQVNKILARCGALQIEMERVRG